MTLAAMTALVARPTLFPICATVLKTLPANAWSRAGKTAVMTRFETVNRTSAPTGFRKTAGKAQAQYVHSGWIMHISSEPMLVNATPIRQAQSARTRCATRPMTTLESAPPMGVGRNRRLVCIGEISWTSWKKSVCQLSIALKTPQTTKTPTQMTLKMRFRQREFGITAGRPSFSCRPTQSINEGMRATPRTNRESVSGSLILSVRFEMILM